MSCVLLGTACAPVWYRVDEKTPRPFPMTTVEMTMDMPLGWRESFFAPLGGIYFFTKHGAELEEIWIRRWPKTQVVKGTNRSITNEMTIQDMASLSLDSRRLDDGVGALEVVSNRPVTIGDQSCYRLDYRYRDGIGLSKRTVEYGCPIGKWFYRFEYNAPTQHYFESHLKVFEEMARTIRFTRKGI